MDAIYIINTSNSDILLSKEFKENENNIKLGVFLMEMNNILKYPQSPFVKIRESIFIYLQEKSIMYLSILSEDNLINSIYNTLSIINNSLLQAFDFNLQPDSIRENIVEILLMIDQFLLAGVPIINETNALSTNITPYQFKDKLTEKFIGKAKDFDTRTLLNFVRDSQTSYDNYKYHNENIKINNEILFHYNDYLDISCDKSFNQLNKTVSSEIEVISQIPNNIELNLLLNIPFNIYDCSVDESVLTKKKEILKKKNLDCVLKHGIYKLVRFIPEIPSKIQLPFKISVTSNFLNNNLNLNIHVELEPVGDVFYPIDDIDIKLFFPKNFNNSNLSVNTGNFEYYSDKSEKMSSRWFINKLEKGSTLILKGSLSQENTQINSNNCFLVLSCKIDKFSISGGSITKGTITKNPKNIDISKKGRNFTFIRNLEIIF